ncbi:MAG: MBL fold metallo-hydrolase [Candidatus Aminicenantes bacterium]
MEFESVVVGALETNCYVVYCPETLECGVVDPGAEAEKIIRIILRKKLNPVIILNTHGHVDHVGANQDLKDRFNVPLCLHPADRSMLKNILQSDMGFLLGAKESPAPDRDLKDGEEVKIGRSSLRVVHTPGHSPGSVSFLGDGFLLSGDAIFYGGVGRTDLPGGSWQELENSIRSKILTLPPETSILPGHGPFTSVRQEKNWNPFIR